MFFNKSKVQPMGKLTDKEIAEAEKFYKQITGAHIALQVLSNNLGELEQTRLDWWDKVTEDHMLKYDKDSETLSYEPDGTINKKRK